jgi:hypothetical protein
MNQSTFIKVKVKMELKYLKQFQENWLSSPTLYLHHYEVSLVSVNTEKRFQEATNL